MLGLANQRLVSFEYKGGKDRTKVIVKVFN
jgi:hypothetical protein